MISSRIRTLLDQYLHGTLSDEELNELTGLMELPEQEEELQKFVKDTMLSDEHQQAIDAAVKERLREFLVQENALDPLPAITPVRTIFTRRLKWAAAAILLLTGTAAVWYYSAKTTTDNGIVQSDVHQIDDIQPGRYGGTLVLADGSTVSLDQHSNGRLVQQAGAELFLQDGTLCYQPLQNKAEKNNDSTTFNTLRIPAGRQLHLILPDGSDVWLNAASSITFPTAFNKKERRVKVSGEVFFDVKPAAARMPFIVAINNRTSVQVLGTAFNVKAYEGETQMAITLMRGAVQVVSDNKKTLLNPGQQLQLDNLSGAATIHTTTDAKSGREPVPASIDTSRVSAWKKGMFSFDQSRITDVMQELARWYDVKIDYQGSIPESRFGGEISKDLTLIQILQFLERTSNFRFKLNSNTIIVTWSAE